MAPDVILLAIPGCTNPHGLMTCLRIVPCLSLHRAVKSGNTGAPLTVAICPVDQPAMLRDGSVAESVPLQLPHLATAAEDQPSTVNDSKPLSSEDGKSRGSLAGDTAHRHTLVVSRIIGELSRHRPPLQSFSFREFAIFQEVFKRRGFRYNHPLCSLFYVPLRSLVRQQSGCS
jgi:hypothetical protein